MVTHWTGPNDEPKRPSSPGDGREPAPDEDGNPDDRSL